MEEKTLKGEIKIIKSRNERVELDKKWETSWTRRICICLMTYAVVIIYSLLIQSVSNPFLTSLVPVLGFLLSTLSLNRIRKIWQLAMKNKRK